MLDYLDIFLIWEGWIYLVILSVLEIVLGIDNILFISIVTEKLEPKDQRKARTLGLSIALILRLALLSVVSILMRLTEPLFTVNERSGMPSPLNSLTVTPFVSPVRITPVL